MVVYHKADTGEIGRCLGLRAEVSRTSRTIQLANTGCVRVEDQEVIYVTRQVGLGATEVLAGGASDEVWDGSSNKQGRDSGKARGLWRVRT